VNSNIVVAICKEYQKNFPQIVTYHFGKKEKKFFCRSTTIILRAFLKTEKLVFMILRPEEAGSYRRNYVVFRGFVLLQTE